MLPNEEIGVSEFIDLLNQTFELALPYVNIVGELANFKISKNKWLYFDLKDERSTLGFFGTVYQLNGPLEDGMMLKVASSPHMHDTYGFSMQVQAIELVGEGSIKRAAELLQVKLTKEGLFDMGRKRPLPYPPNTVGLITSAQSAAYHDFTNIIFKRWRGLNIQLADVQVQGEIAASQIISAINHFNTHPDEIETIVIIRGGGSPEDLAVFSNEAVTRAVAASKIPTLVAIGHEIDVSLAELAADRRASTPSHAAEIIVPDIKVINRNLLAQKLYLHNRAKESLIVAGDNLERLIKQVKQLASERLLNLETRLAHEKALIGAYNPQAVLARGYAIVRKKGRVVRSASSLSVEDIIDITLAKGNLKSTVKEIEG